MYPQFVVLLLSVTVVGAQLYPPQPEQPDIGSEVQAQIDIVNQEIAELEIEDARITVRVEDETSVTRANSQWRDTFLNDFYPHLAAEQKRQTKLVVEIDAQVQELLTFLDDVSELNSTIKTLNSQVGNLRDLGNSTVDRLDYLRKETNLQTAALKYAESQFVKQEKLLDGIDEAVHVVVKRLERYSLVIEKLNQLLAEQGAETTEITLTPENSEQVYKLHQDFGGNTPALQYGVKAIHISDHTQTIVIPVNPYSGGYGKPDNLPETDPDYPQIDYLLEVNLDLKNKQVNAVFADKSIGGWTVDKVIVQASVYYISDKEINVYDH